MIIEYFRMCLKKTTKLFRYEIEICISLQSGDLLFTERKPVFLDVLFAWVYNSNIFKLNKEQNSNEMYA